MSAVASAKNFIEDPYIPSGLAQIANDYDGFIIDLWGVIHNGIQLFPDIINCFEQLKKLNKTIVLLSNAPRSSGVTAEKLVSVGLPENLYDWLLTSGDLTIDYLRRNPARSYYHIGSPERDSSLLVGIGMNPVPVISEAEIIIASNLLDEKPSVDHYHQDFLAAIANQVPMVCANPDIMVCHGDETWTCVGALAEKYQTLGGTVKFFGKPHNEVYDSIFNRFEGKKWLAIGDSLSTDIRGANLNKIDSLLVLSGIHGNEILLDNPATWSAFNYYSVGPSYIMNQLSWS